MQISPLENTQRRHTDTGRTGESPAPSEKRHNMQTKFTNTHLVN